MDDPFGATFVKRTGASNWRITQTSAIWMGNDVDE
jgi:hypothetical protein